MHGDAKTVWGKDLCDYPQEPGLQEGRLVWRPSPSKSLDQTVLRDCTSPFAAKGGLSLLDGNLGRSVMKVSAVPESLWQIEGPAIVIDDQDALEALFSEGQLNRDCVVVVRGQGPKANGMPELHKLTPFLGALQDQGYRVALVTDGRMSGASGKVPAAIHVSPEAVAGGAIGKIQNGDRITIDAERGELNVLVDASELSQRAPWQKPTTNDYGCARFLFGNNRMQLSDPESGATYLFEAVSQ
jgi:phosphogluconate dehydratase